MKKSVIVVIALLAVLKLATLMQAEPITYYVYLTNHEVTRFGEIIWWWTPDTLNGPMRSNDYIGLKYSPVFYGWIITAKDEFRYYQPGNIYFAYPPTFNAPPFDFPRNWESLEAIATTHINDANGRNKTWVSFRGGQGVDIYQYPLGGERAESLVTHVGTNGRQVIWVDGEVEMEGTIDQQVTVAASGDIYLIDDLRYEGANEWGRWQEGEVDAMLGVASERNIIIANTEANGRNGGYDRAPNDMGQHSIVLNGSFIALNESFTFEDQNDDRDQYQGPTPDERGFIWLTGGIAQWRRGYVHRSNNVGTGYGKSWHYDWRLLRNGPPGFGPGEYLDVHGEYDRLLLLPANYEIDAARVGVLTIMPGATLKLHGVGSLLVTDSLIAIGTAEEPITVEGMNGGGALRVIQGGAYARLEYVNFAENIELTVEGSDAIVNKCRFGGEVSLQGLTDVDSSVFSQRLSVDGFGASKVSRSLMLRGLDIRGRGRSLEVVNNTITTSRGAGVLVRSGEGVVVKNNIVSLCRYGVVNDGQDEPAVSYNCMFDNSDGNYVDCEAGAGAIEADPRFIDRRRENFQLGWGSPCVDVGDPASPRDPDGSRADMGAYYFDHILGAPQDDFGLRILDFGLEVAPNPFNAATTVEYSMKSAGRVSISVVDLHGRKIAELVNGWQEAGAHRVVWNNPSSPAGMYILRAEGNGKAEAVKVVKVD